MPSRREDDPQTETDVKALEEWWANLPAMRKKVESNHKEVLSLRKQTLFLFVLFALVGTSVVYYLGSINSNTVTTLRESRISSYNTCKDINENARKFNQLVDTIIKRVETAPGLSPKQRQDAIDLYSSAKQTLPVCDPVER